MNRLLLTLLVPLLATVSCRPEDVTVSYVETRDGLARFDVHNGTERDLRSMSFELSFYSEAGDMVHVDTVEYTMAGDTTAFVLAGSETFFVTRAPTDAASATGRVFAFTFMDDAPGAAP